MQPILFAIAGPVRNKQANGQRGVPPNLAGVFQLPSVRLRIIGVTKDSTGAVLAGCTVTLFRTIDNVAFETVTSDGNGAYSFSAIGLSETYYVVAYKPGSPDVAGTTVNTLEGVA